MKKFLFLLYSTLIFVFAQSCKDDDDPATNADSSIYNEIISDQFVFYREGATLNAAPASPHGSFKLRFNQIAFDALDENEELPVGESFPTGSVIVKEVYNGNALALYAVIKKDPPHEDAGNGWLWAEYNTDGSPAYSVSNKGVSCIGCHSDTPNRDLVRTFDFH